MPKTDATLEQSELDEVKDLQGKYTDVILRMGQASLQVDQIETALDELKEKKEGLVQEHQVLRTTETEMVQRLTEKYGNGNLDVNTGVFTPSD
jgi:hypothetical protein